MAEMERRCILTRKVAARNSMIRFVLSPGGDVIADLAFKLPGRGASVLPDRKVLAEALGKGKLSGALSRAFGEPVARDKISAQLLDVLEAGLLKRCSDRLGQAQRSGDCVAGFDKIQAAIRSGADPGLLLIAADAGDDGRKKMVSLMGGDVPIDYSLSREVLSLALGTGNSVHVMISKGRNAELLVEELTRYRGIVGDA